MDQVHVIRHKVLVEGQGIRKVAREMRVSRNTVRKYLRVTEPVRAGRRSAPTTGFGAGGASNLTLPENYLSFTPSRSIDEPDS